MRQRRDPRQDGFNISFAITVIAFCSMAQALCEDTAVPLWNTGSFWNALLLSGKCSIAPTISLGLT
jgi:hypothetical protein